MKSAWSLWDGVRVCQDAGRVAVTGWDASVTGTIPSSTLATPELPVTVASIAGPKTSVSGQAISSL